MSPKLKSMLAHLTPLGWLVALILNGFKRDKLSGFYIRQSLGVYLCFLIVWFIPDYYIIAWGFFFVLWIYSFVGALKTEENLIPFIGPYFQKWFKVIS